MRNALNRRLARYLAQKIAGEASAQLMVLEAGSGPGYCASRLKAMGQGIWPIIFDIDQEVLDIAVRRDKQITAVRGDLYRIAFKADTFDLVFNSSTLEHLSDVERAFDEMVRITKPGGKIFVGVPYKYGVFFPFNFLPKGHRASVWMGKLYSRKELTTMCVREGLVVDNIFFYCFRGFVGLLLAKTHPTRCS